MSLKPEKQAEYYNEIFDQYNKKYHSKYVEMVGGLELMTGIDTLGNKELGHTIDIGCGTGRNYRFIKEKCLSYTGIDISQKQIEQARLSNNQEEKASFFTGNALDLELGSGRFDTVIMFGCLHHLEDPQKALKEAHRVLRKGGTILIYEPSKHNPILRLIRFFFKKYHPAFHPEEVSFFRDELVELFNRAGFISINAFFQIYLTGFFSLYNIKKNIIIDGLFNLFQWFDKVLVSKRIPMLVKKQSFSIAVIAKK